MKEMCLEESFPKVLYDNVPFVSELIAQERFMINKIYLLAKFPAMADTDEEAGCRRKTILRLPTL